MSQRRFITRGLLVSRTLHIIIIILYCVKGDMDVTVLGRV
jgi:hypothetical protein